MRWVGALSLLFLIPALMFLSGAPLSDYVDYRAIVIVLVSAILGVLAVLRRQSFRSIRVLFAKRPSPTDARLAIRCARSARCGLLVGAWIAVIAGIVVNLAIPMWEEESALFGVEVNADIYGESQALMLVAPFYAVLISVFVLLSLQTRCETSLNTTPATRPFEDIVENLFDIFVLLIGFVVSSVFFAVWQMLLATTR